jgi:hypothetical protein
MNNNKLIPTIANCFIKPINLIFYIQAATSGSTSRFQQLQLALSSPSTFYSTYKQQHCAQQVVHNCRPLSQAPSTLHTSSNISPTPASEAHVSNIPLATTLPEDPNLDEQDAHLNNLS